MGIDVIAPLVVAFAGFIIVLGFGVYAWLRRHDYDDDDDDDGFWNEW